MPKFTPAKSTDSAASFDHLPKKIFQTWETDQVPQGMYDAMHSWIDLNPDWEHHFFTDDDRRAFIQQHFDQGVIDAYDNLIPGAYRADLWMYCVLYIHGGIYADCKLVLHQPLNILLPQNCEFIMAKDIEKNREFSNDLWTALIFSAPKHPFLEKAIRMVADNVKRGYYGWDALSPTGPNLMGKALNLSINETECTPINPGEYQYKTNTYIILPTLKRPIGIDIPPYENCITAYSGYYSKDRLTNNHSKIADPRDYEACWIFNHAFKHGKSQRPAGYCPKKFLKSTVRGAYKQNNPKVARLRLIKAFKIKWFNLPLLLVVIKYELKLLFTREKN